MIFKLKFTYKRADEDGNVVKSKMEVFAECINYSDAEKLAYELMEKENMARFDSPDYEIVKTKYTANDFIDHSTLQYEEGNTVNGLIEHYFAGDEDAFFVVNMKIITFDEKGREHRSPAVCIVSDSSIQNAVSTVRNYMKKGLCDFIITGTKMDDAETLYLTTESHKTVLEKYEA